MYFFLSFNILSYNGLKKSSVMKLALGTLMIYKFFLKSSYEAEIRYFTEYHSTL